jgi:DNA polymerase elongation subunit (family B)
VEWKNLKKLSEEDSCPEIPQPLILSFDLEANSHNPGKFCDGNHPDDKIFQISCVFGYHGSPKDEWIAYLLSLGNPRDDKVGCTKVLKYKTEAQMLLGFVDLMHKYQPHILIGYNIYKFDYPYLITRAKLLFIYDEFVRQGFTYEPSEERHIQWSSSAYSNQEMTFLDAHGRLIIDLYPLILRDYKLPSYKLDSVAKEFIGSQKDPFTALDIFLCYRLGMKDFQETPEKLSEPLGYVGKYCVRDSELVLELFEKLQYWFGLTEMASVCNVPISKLYLHGQQIRVFSRIYKYCFENNIVVENGAYTPKDDEQYQGAYVFTPMPGLYDNVVTLDFASMYPNSIITWNLDYTTMVVDKTIPDSMCHVIEWEHHVNCGHSNAEKDRAKDTICEHYRYRFLKEPKGIVPTILENFLTARKQTRKLMKQYDKDSAHYKVLDKRQLAYKTISNSVYGFLGARKGYLPFMPCACATTALGRSSIQKTATIATEEFKAQVVYGDSDSILCSFPHLSDPNEIWSYAEHVAASITKRFPGSMVLEFEEKIYWRFLVLTKKRYMSISCDVDGKIQDKIDKKGVLLARRDNSTIVQTIYEKIVRKLLYKESRESMIEVLHIELNKLCSGAEALEAFVVTKSIGDIDKLILQPFNSMKNHYGDYVIPKLSDDPVLRMKQMEKKRVTTPEQFHISSLPGPVQLALRMRSRGQVIGSGERISFVVTKNGGSKANVSEKMEEFDYFKQYYPRSFIEQSYYMKALINPLDELLEIVYGYHNFIKEWAKNTVKYQDVLNELNRLYKPEIKFNS